jgi:hypothetical protein
MRAEIELGNHVGICIVILDNMVRPLSVCKMYVNQVRWVLLIQGTARQIDIVRKRVGVFLDRVTNEDQSRMRESGMVF